jgi:hypothetical protein
MMKAIQVLPGSGKNSPARTCAIFALVALLAGCGGDHVESAGTKVVYQRVEVPVPTPCPVTKPAKPKPLARPLPADPARLIDLLVAKLTELMGPGGYVERADAAITTCTKPN